VSFDFLTDSRLVLLNTAGNLRLGKTNRETLLYRDTIEIRLSRVKCLALDIMISSSSISGMPDIRTDIIGRENTTFRIV
jgi:hypothetical protein